MKTSQPFLNRSAIARPFAAGLILLALTPLLPAQDTPPPPAAEASGETFTPLEYGMERYQKLRGKSPFEFELAKPPVEPAADPFADLILASYGGYANNASVTLLNTKTQERISVFAQGTGRKNENGYQILSVNKGRTLSNTTVTVEKDGQKKELGFDTKLLYSMVGGAGGGGGAAAGGRPAVPGQPNNGQPNGQPVIRPAGMPAQAARPYQAPQPVNITRGGQSNRNVGNQPGMAGQANFGAPQPGVPASPGGATEAQQQLNAMLANPAAQPNVVPTPTVPAANPGNNAAQNPPRRRVVLPSTP
jgi:hypothetical protein